DGEELLVRRRKLRARVGRHLASEDLTRVAEFLGELVSTPFPDETSPPLRAARRDAVLRGDQMRRAWEDLVEADGTARPLVLVLADLHGGDRPSVEFVDAALRPLEGRPLFVLALARPDIHDLFPDLWSERRMQEVRLAELPRRAALSLAREVLGPLA